MRLLVVEDEVRLARALQKGLRSEGFAVDLSHDGAAGLESARSGNYDAIVLDVMLPRLSGYEVVRALRRDRNWVPVLMLSAKDGEFDEADGLDVGADDYMIKPFDVGELKARIGQRSGRKQFAVVGVGGGRREIKRKIRCRHWRRAQHTDQPQINPAGAVAF